MYPRAVDLKAMASAIEAGDIEKVRNLIATRIYVRSTLIDAQEKHTALHLAAIHGRLDICKLLLQHGANVHAVNCRGSTPLHCCVGSGRSDAVAGEICSLFVRAGALVDARNNDGMTALSFASNWREEAAVRLLVEKGANVRSVDNSGKTPLHQAAQSADAAMCRLLLNAGADIDAFDATGDTPLHKLCSRRSSLGDPDVAQTLEVLTSAGAQPDFVPAGMLEQYQNVFKTTYLTPFQRAVKMECLEAIRILVEDGRQDLAQSTLDERTMEDLAGTFRPRTIELLQALSTGSAVSSAVDFATGTSNCRPSRVSGPVL